MPYLLDTNALSELDKPVPDTELYVSCVTIGELYKGIERLDPSAKRQRLLDRTDAIVCGFENRLLIVNAESSRIWAKLIISCAKKGHAPPVLDAYIATHSLQHQLTLVTHNIKDFESFEGLRILNPWAN